MRPKRSFVTTLLAAAAVFAVCVTYSRTPALRGSALAAGQCCCTSGPCDAASNGVFHVDANLCCQEAVSCACAACVVGDGMCELGVDHASALTTGFLGGLALQRAPRVDAPRVELPRVDMPRVELPRVPARASAAMLAAGSPREDSVFESAMPLRSDLGAALDQQEVLDTALAFPVNSETTAELKGLHAWNSRREGVSLLSGMEMNGVRRSAAQCLAAASMAVSTAVSAAEQRSSPWAYSTFIEAVESDQVEKVSFAADGRSVLAIDKDGNRHETAILPDQSANLIKELTKHNVVFAVQSPEQPGLANAIGPALLNLAVPIGILGALAFFASRNNGGAGGAGGGGMGGMGSPFDVGKSKSKIQMEPQTGVGFDDVAGCDGSKFELNEVVEFLKDPAKFSALGAKIPRGVIMEGPPGTGKTLLARAVAGEAGVPFVSASGSEFVEMFVGVGASRVRDLFAQAKKNAPCIVFIDEIDAVGRARSSGGGGMGGGNDEREQTLNQILTEMDGFEGNQGVIVIAATNRADVLDSALLRPGRFDRRVPVDLPDMQGREDILKVHIRGKPIANEVSLGIIAKRTIGFSGAQLANLMNEAAIVAARRDKTEISYSEIDYAIDRLTVGMEKTTGMKFKGRQKLVAYHEAGHAVMGALTPDYDLVTKVTIIPRSNGAGGFTLFTPPEERLDSGMYSMRYLEGQLAVALGGRVAEEIVFGLEEVTTGASNDLQQVRNIARRMVAQWGFSKNKLGATSWESPDGNGGFGPKGASAATEKAIDDEVKELVDAAYAHCKKTLLENRKLLDEVTDALLEKETIDFRELYTLVGKYDPALEAAQKANFPPEMGGPGGDAPKVEEAVA